jgi:hypothetical protein
MQIKEQLISGPFDFLGGTVLSEIAIWTKPLARRTLLRARL